MILNFKDIPSGNKGGEHQDAFELFSRDFLLAIGFEIIQHPHRGPDGKKDMIVRGKWLDDKTINWLVSCKHNAHSKKYSSVSDEDEPNITERLIKHGCQGFIGIYSTIASASLSDLLHGNREVFRSEIFDHERIENFILEKGIRHKLIWRYFSSSYEKHKEELDRFHQKEKSGNKSKASNMTEEDILRITKTAIIEIEIVKIKERYFSVDWKEKEKIIGELFKFANHSTTIVSEAIFEFLSDASQETRMGMTKELSTSIFALTLEFFPSTSSVKDNKKMIELAGACLEIGFNMAYDSTIHRTNLNIAMDGLTIFKYIYKKGGKKGLEQLRTMVHDTYNRLESALSRPERNDLGNAQELVKFFKADLDQYDLSYPPLSENLYRIIYPDQYKAK